MMCCVCMCVCFCCNHHTFRPYLAQVALADGQCDGGADHRTPPTLSLSLTHTHTHTVMSRSIASTMLSPFAAARRKQQKSHRLKISILSALFKCCGKRAAAAAVAIPCAEKGGFCSAPAHTHSHMHTRCLGGWGTTHRHPLSAGARQPSASTEGPEWASMPSGRWGWS